MAVELVIFDMDGLMIDTEPLSKEGWRLALAYYGFEMHEELFSQLLGRNLTTARQLMCGYYGPDFDFDAVREKRTAFVEAHIKEQGISMKKGLLHILDCLDQMGVKKCIATSTEWEGMENKLGQLGLLSRFDGFVTGDQVKLSKPNPEIFLKAASLVGIDPVNCIVLEDSPAGVAAAYEAGMRSIVIPDMAQPDQETLGKVYARCEDLIEAAELIDNLRTV